MRHRGITYQLTDTPNRRGGWRVSQHQEPQPVNPEENQVGLEAPNTVARK